MVRQTARIIFLEIIGALALLLVIAASLLVVRLASGPIELSHLRVDVEREISKARGNQPVALEGLWLAWSPKERRILVTATGVVLYTHAGDVVASARKAEIDLDVSAMLLGEVRLDALDLDDGHMVVERLFDTVWSVAGSPVSVNIPVADTFDVSLLAERANEFSQSIFEALPEAPERHLIRRVSIRNFAVTVRNVHGRRLAEIPDLEAGFISAQAGALEFSFQASSVGKGLPDTLGLTLTMPEDRSRLDVALSLNQWSVGDLLARVVVAEEAGLAVAQGLPLSGEVSLSASRQAGVTRLGFAVDVGQGRFGVRGRDVTLQSASVAAELDVAAQTLAVTVDDLASSVLGGSFVLTLPDVLALRSTAPFPLALTSPGLTIDARPKAQMPWQFADVSATGSLDLQAGVLKLDAFKAGLAEAQASGSANLRWKGDDFPVPEGPPVALEADVAIDGKISKEELFAFWLVDLGPEVRAQVANDFLGGTLTDVGIRLNIQPGSLRDGIMADEAVDVRYRLTGGSYRFLPDIPAATAASGRGHLRGNSLRIDIDSARISDWQAQSAVIEISAFKPEGQGTLTVSGKGSGPLMSAFRVLQNSRLQLGRAEGLDVSRISGTGTGSFTFERPIGAEVPVEAVRYTVLGTAEGAGLEAVVGEFDLTGVRASANIDPTQAIINGTGRLADTPVRFDVVHQFAEGLAAPTRIEASAVATPSTLNALGMFARAYITGSIPVTVSAAGRLPDLARVEFAFDLDDTRIDIPEIGLLKPQGARANAAMSYEAATAVRPAFYTAKFGSAGAQFDGDVRLTRDQRVDVVSLRRAYVATRMDVAGEIARDPLDGLRVTLVGEYLDASGFLGTGMGQADGQSGDGLTGNLVLQADVQRLTLREGLDVREAALSARVQSGEVKSLTARGLTAPGERFTAELQTEAGGQRRFSVTADNAGFLLLAVFGLDTVTGGRLESEGVLGRPGGASEFTLNLFDARVRDAPFITQILSLASLRGLADTLAGDGLLFTRVEIPIRHEGERFTFRGGRASGPALGLTFSGSIDTGPSRAITLGGVLVPSFGVNSALGGIPIIGDLFVSRQGEGVFSVRYDVAGTLDKAQVTANLLSAITPGVLRRIFENPNEADIDRLRNLDDAAPAAPIDEGKPKLPPPPPDSPAATDPAR